MLKLLTAVPVPALLSLVFYSLVVIQMGCGAKVRREPRDPDWGWPRTELPKIDETEPHLPNLDEPIGKEGVTYRYDEDKDDCFGDGEKGHNYNVVGECGFVSERDMTGEKLEGKNLRGMFFSKVNLSDANLKGADLTGATLYHVDLTGADLSDASLRLSSLFTTKFDRANLKGTDFIKFSTTENAYKGPVDLDVTYQDAEIDYRTLIDFTIEDAESKGMIYQGEDFDGTITDPSGLTIRYAKTGDAKVSELDARRLGMDVLSLRELRFKPVEGPWFKKIFKLTNAQEPVGPAILRYLADRLKYMITRKTDDKSTVAYNASSLWYFKMWNGMVDRGETEGDTTQYKLATYDIDGTTVTIDHARAGVFGIGKGYRKLWEPYISRLGALVHEARHSDCDDVPWKADVIAWVNDRYDDMKWHACNHIHVSCKSGDFKGENACDAHAWGAYAFSYIFAEELARSCASCTEEERLAATMNAIDMKSRIEVFDDMIQGKLGDPVLERQR